MPVYPGCRNCEVVKGVKDLLEKYRYFLEVSQKPNCVYMTAHATGYHHGKVSTVEDFLEDLALTYEYIVEEQPIRGGR